MIPHGIIAGGSLLPLSLGRVWDERQLEGGVLHRNITRNWCEEAAKQPLHLRRDKAALLAGDLDLVTGDAAVRVAVRPAANGHQGCDPRQLTFDLFRGETRPVAAD